MHHFFAKPSLNALMRFNYHFLSYQFVTDFPWVSSRFILYATRQTICSPEQLSTARSPANNATMRWLCGDAKSLNLGEQNRACGAGSRKSRVWMMGQRRRWRETWRKKKKREREHVRGGEKGADAADNDSSE